MHREDSENIKRGFDFTNTPILNQNNVEKFKSLTQDEPELLFEIFNSFIEDSSILVKEIELSVKTSQTEKFSKGIHTLKGLSASIGASRLFQITDYLDDINKNDNFEVAKEYLPLLIECYNELISDIKKTFLSK